MRNLLQFLEGNRFIFEGVIQRTGIRSTVDGTERETVMIKNIKLANKKTVICDHVWINSSKHLKEAKIGDVVQFEASVSKYVKGYKGEKNGINRPIKIDYNINKFSHVKVIGKTFAESIKEEKTNFNITLTLPKNNKLPKDDWSNFFIDKINNDRKIGTNDMMVPIKTIILKNLEKNRSLSFIAVRIKDFKRWVKGYNQGYLY